jgi:hypothetical protein
MEYEKYTHNLLTIWNAKLVKHHKANDYHNLCDTIQIICSFSSYLLPAVLPWYRSNERINNYKVFIYTSMQR